MERAKNTPDSTVDHRAIAREVHLQQRRGTSSTIDRLPSRDFSADNQRKITRDNLTEFPRDLISDRPTDGPDAACYVETDRLRARIRG